MLMHFSSALRLLPLSALFLCTVACPAPVEEPEEEVPTDNDGDNWETPLDCDDEDPDVHPGADELCDGLDNDCDDLIDDEIPEDQDLDGDGALCFDDCDDDDDDVYPGAPEDPENGIDDDCDGEVDEETEVGDCSAPPPPYTVEISGGLDHTIVLDEIVCSAFGNDTWSVSMSNSDEWLLRVVAGPVVDGEAISESIDITLVQQMPDGAIYAARSDDGHVASLAVEGYIGEAPCGTWTTESLPDTSASGGASVEIGPQPLAFRCPE